MSEEREQEVVAGTVAGVTKKAADQWQIEVAVEGSQYPKKPRTKSAAVVDQLEGMLGQRVQILCNVSHWTNSEGKPVRSLWVEKIMDGTEPPVSAPQPVAPVSQPQSSPIDPRQQSIERQTALKAAVDLYVGFGSQATQGVDTAAVVLECARRFADFLETGLPMGEPPVF